MGILFPKLKAFMMCFQNIKYNFLSNNVFLPMDVLALLSTMLGILVLSTWKSSTMTEAQRS